MEKNKPCRLNVTDNRFSLPCGPGKRVHCPTTDILYELQDQIGSGSAAVVFRARQVILQNNGNGGDSLDMSQEFAAKVFDLRRLRLNSNYHHEREKLLREMTILKNIQHPCIVNLLHVIETPDEIYFIMELVKGGELFYKIIEKGSFSEDETRYIVVQVLYALHYLHQKNIMHRDLKPENILLADETPSNFYTIKLADFGLARFFQSGISEAKTFVGTPQYWAPEVIDCASGRSCYGPQADLWSLGCVIYVMLGGGYPFDTRMGPVDVLIKQAKFHFRYPRFQCVSENAKHLIRGLLTVDPKQRFTMKQVLQHPWIQSFFLSSHVPPLPVFQSFDEIDVSAKATVSLVPSVSSRNASKDGVTFQPRPITVAFASSSASNTSSSSLCTVETTQPHKSEVSPEPQTFLTSQHHARGLGTPDDTTLGHWTPGALRFIDPSNKHNQPLPDRVFPSDKGLSVPLTAPWSSETMNGPLSSGASCAPVSKISNLPSRIICLHEKEKVTNTSLRGSGASWRDQQLANVSEIPSKLTTFPPIVEYHSTNCVDNSEAADVSSFQTPPRVPDTIDLVHSPLDSQEFNLIPPVKLYNAWRMMFSIFLHKCDENRQASNIMFNLEDLLCQQLSIMQRVHFVYIVLRYSPHASKYLKECILEKHGIQMHSIEIIQQFETMCYSVLALFPDLFWSITEHQPELGVQLLEDVLTWILSLKARIVCHQKRLEAFLTRVSDLVELIRTVKIATDHDVINSLKQYGPTLASLPSNESMFKDSTQLTLSPRSRVDNASFLSSNPLTKRTGCVIEKNALRQDKFIDINKEVTARCSESQTYPTDLISTEPQAGVNVEALPSDQPSDIQNKVLSRTPLVNILCPSANPLRPPFYAEETAASAVNKSISSTTNVKTLQLPHNRQRTSCSMTTTMNDSTNITLKDVSKDHTYIKNWESWCAKAQTAVFQQLQTLVETTIKRMLDKKYASVFFKSSQQRLELAYQNNVPPRAPHTIAQYTDATSLSPPFECTSPSRPPSVDLDIVCIAKELLELIILTPRSSCITHHNFLVRPSSHFLFNHAGISQLLPSQYPASSKNRSCVTRLIHVPTEFFPATPNVWICNETSPTQCTTPSSISSEDRNASSHTLDNRFKRLHSLQKKKTGASTTDPHAFQDTNILYHPSFQHQAVYASRALGFALQEVREVELSLRRCLAFWVNLIVTIERLSQIKMHTSRLLKHSGASPYLTERLEKLLAEYQTFWITVKDQLWNYARHAKGKMDIMENFAISLNNAAEHIDGVLTPV